MSYRMQIEPKSRKAARFISRLQKAIQKALIESGKTQQQVATELGVDRSVVNRRLKGNANLTARSMAEFAHVFDKDIVVSFVDRTAVEGSNAPSATNNVIDLDDHRGSPTTGTVQPCKTFSLESASL